MGKGSKVCVIGGSGYLGSSLVKKLLDYGYTVHATVRNLKDEAKVGLLKGFVEAEEEDRLVLFEADIYNPHQFEAAIQGCDFVFLVATPFQHFQTSQYKDLTEAAVCGVKSIVECCIKSGRVKKVIYTASVVAASPLKQDATFKDVMDETCWTPLNLSFPLHGDYTNSKTLAEREILSYGNKKDGCGIEVVSLACGLVGGDTLLSSMPLSMQLFISHLKHDEFVYNSLKFLEDLLGKIPIVHIDDVCDAHIFCLDNPINGRFLVAASYVSSAEIANYYLQAYPELHLNKEYLDGPNREIKWGSTKLNDKGFVYKYDMKMILDGCVKCARKLGDL